MDPQGGFETRDGGEVYRISHVDQMAPFLMSVVSDSNHWMYLSSRGGLTAGRVDEATSLFPYETDDRLHAAYGVTGPLTVVRVLTDDGETVLWRPFEPRRTDGGFERNLAKSVVGNWVEFEEVDHTLGLAFRCRWSTSDRFGFVRSVMLRRDPTAPVRSAQVLDGFLNLMPAGVPLSAQQTSSTLVDAYKRSELDVATGLGLFTIEAQMSDRAEAAESLRANVVWWRGLRAPRVLLSDEQLDRFLQEGIVEEEHLTLGRRGAYLVAFDLDLREADETRWELVADVGLAHGQVAELRALIRDESDVGLLIAADVADATANLTAIIAGADGLQHTADHTASAHHAANVLFNTMRGGTFLHNHTVPADDFVAFVAARNRPVSEAHGELIAALAGETDIASLVESSATTGDAALRRLIYEYLPIFFSRRHGDPSRPWNRFAIRTKNDDGTRRLDYQGNWRDIFQNWEALTLSFPGFLESIIAKFVNASTVDGYNPYRITRGGIDWEVPEPDNPWSNIGYWGDHQIVYLLRLLESLERYQPGAVIRLLDQSLFSYGAVPYRIAPYEQIAADPKATIEFDKAAATIVARRVEALGADGALVADDTGSIYHVTLAEKLLVPALANLSNLVLEGGIWMNTQRPEWNDANNALVGNGLSMVTLSYLRRYLAFLRGVFEADRSFLVSEEVVRWCDDVLGALRDALPEAGEAVGDTKRRRVLDALGTAASDYRSRVYRDGFSGRAELAASTIGELCRTALTGLDHSIRANRRDDGLYHSYNLLALGSGDARVEHLPAMLEGQVAVLSCGILSDEESLELIDALFASDLYRSDQDSFMLYPARRLPPFLEKNAIPRDRVEGNPLLRTLIEAGDTSVVARDASGIYRFHPDCGTSAGLDAALAHLAEEARWSDLATGHRDAIREIFEDVFHHRAFTGRSGSMYKYEGLGSIYWHMVAKLLVAVQERFFEAVDRGTNDATIAGLAAAYHRVRDGLGFNKTPGEFGAFPIDPYSHTPAGAGAQQPGMTGQVKEEIITRFGELGVRVSHGTVWFEPRLLRRHEFLTEDTAWRFLDVDGNEEKLTLPAGSLGFTYCGVPVVYRLTATDPTIAVIGPAGDAATVAGTRLDRETARLLFRRGGAIRRIEVGIPEAVLMEPAG